MLYMVKTGSRTFFYPTLARAIAKARAGRRSLIYARECLSASWRPIALEIWTKTKKFA